MSFLRFLDTRKSPEGYIFHSQVHPTGVQASFSKKNNNFSTTRPIFDLKVLLNRAHQDLQIFFSGLSLQAIINVKKYDPKSSLLTISDGKCTNLSSYPTLRTWYANTTFQQLFMNELQFIFIPFQRSTKTKNTQ